MNIDKELLDILSMQATIQQSINAQILFPHSKSAVITLDEFMTTIAMKVAHITTKRMYAYLDLKNDPENKPADLLKFCVRPMTSEEWDIINNLEDEPKVLHERVEEHDCDTCEIAEDCPIRHLMMLLKNKKQQLLNLEKDPIKDFINKHKN